MEQFRGIIPQYFIIALYRWEMEKWIFACYFKSGFIN